MSWRAWVIAVVVLILAFAIMYAVSIYGGNKVDRFLELQAVAISNTQC